MGCLVAGSLRGAATTEPAQTPHACLHAYNAALRTQDANALLPFFTTRTPGEREVVDLLIANELDTARLTVAVEKTFGVKLVGGGSLLPPGGKFAEGKVGGREAF